MPLTAQYGKLAGDTDLSAVARILALAFAGTPEGVVEWVRNGGPENLRGLREGEAVTACLLRIPMGQYFGGASVPMLGIAGVGVAPENRGGGRALRLMRDSVQEAVSEGWPVMGLYASTQAVDRKAV